MGVEEVGKSIKTCECVTTCKRFGWSRGSICIRWRCDGAVVVAVISDWIKEVGREVWVVVQHAVSDTSCGRDKMVK